MGFGERLKQLFELKDEFKGLSEETRKLLVKKARIQATVFGILAVTSLIILVYAYMKIIEAEGFRYQAEVAAMEGKERANQAKADAMLCKGIAEAQRATAQKAFEELQKELDKCQGRKRK